MTKRIARFEPGTLRDRLEDADRRALASGALRPIPTTRTLVRDGGVEFLVRTASGLAPRELARRESEERRRGTGRAPDPFLPYDPELYVADLSDSHVGLLNKFNVLDHHLLIVTREFASQEAPLDLQDFEALWVCMAEFDALAFYNSGVTAGASQAHRHLQMVPLPLLGEGPRLPTDSLISAAVRSAPVGTVPGFAFENAVARIDARRLDSPEAHALYMDLLSAAGGRRAHNLLVTREWMLLVPRTRERFGTISVNALGFAGSFFVRDGEEMRLLEERGPLQVLAGVGVRRPPVSEPAP